MTYSLRRTRDGAGDSGSMSDAVTPIYDEDGIQMMCEDMMSENWKQKGLVGKNLVYCNVNHPFPPGQYNGTWHSLVREDFEQWLR